MIPRWTVLGIGYEIGEYNEFVGFKYFVGRFSTSILPQ
jgi:hypothetical protein